MTKSLPDTPICLLDMGATFIRLLLFKPNSERAPLSHLKVYKVADYPDLLAVLAEYAQKSGSDFKHIAVATAAQKYADGLWRFHDGRVWMNTQSELEQAGYTTVLLTNDFEATARGAMTLGKDELEMLSEGVFDKQLPRVVVGAGTGLGFAYISPTINSVPHVQLTYGGHMLATGLTDEQLLVISTLRTMRGAGGHSVVVEDLASGRAFQILHNVVSRIHGLPQLEASAEDIMKEPQEQVNATVLRLFHEFLGLFLHGCIVNGHAFGGVYLDGGIITRLREQGLLDVETIRRFMVLNPVDVVKEALEAVPLRLIDSPHVALKGLQAFLEERHAA